MRRGLAVACFIATAAACSSDDDTTPPPAEPPPPEDTRPPTPPEWDRSVTRTDEATASAARLDCKFARGALPDETLGKEIPTGTDIPIETIVVLMQENRSFDHYFGRFAKYANRTDVEVAPDDATNPVSTTDPASPKVPWQHGAHLCFADTEHSWKNTHRQVDDGKMDAFVETNGGAGGERAMWWYDERDLPFYYALAKEFAIADHYHSSLPGPTWPNRMFSVAATSFGMIENQLPKFDDGYPASDIVIQDELERRHVDWKMYSDGPQSIATVLGAKLTIRYAPREIKGALSDFYADAAAGKLPPVVWLDSNAIETGDPAGDNEHPPSQIQIGQRYVADVLAALMKSPQWSKMAIFFMYDEHGGLYDHVVPPKACAPDDKTPVDEHYQPVEGSFDTLGVRVPLVVVSPYVKRGFVSHTVYDHTSIMRFIQAKHRIPALSARDANANVPSDFFDFGAPPNTSVPALPEAIVDQAELTYCKQTFSQ